MEAGLGDRRRPPYVVALRILSWYYEPGNGERVRAKYALAGHDIYEARFDDVLDVIHATALESPGGMIDGLKYQEAINSYFVGTDNELAEAHPASDADAARMELERDRERRREMARQMREAAEAESQPATETDDVG